MWHSVGRSSAAMNAGSGHRSTPISASGGTRTPRRSSSRARTKLPPLLQGVLLGLDPLLELLVVARDEVLTNVDGGEIEDGPHAWTGLVTGFVLVPLRFVRLRSRFGEGCLKLGCVSLHGQEAGIRVAESQPPVWGKSPPRQREGAG